MSVKGPPNFKMFEERRSERYDSWYGLSCGGLVAASAIVVSAVLLQMNDEKKGAKAQVVGC